MSVQENLKPFINELQALRLDVDDSQACIEQVKPIVAKWVADPSWLPDDIKKAKTEEDDHIIYIGEEGKLMVLVVVWPTNNESNVHDHLTWGVVGTVQGIEENHAWQRLDDGLKKGFAEIKRAGNIVSTPGHVFSMNDDIIHSVVSSDPSGEHAVSLHVYGRDLTTTGRRKYDPIKKTVQPMLGIDG